MTDEKRIVILKNEDNESLGPDVGKGIVIGYVDEVHGEGGREVPEFIPTRHELIQLVKYWARLAVDVDYFCFLYQQSGSWEIRIVPFAWRRIDRIAGILGNDEVKKVVDEAIAEYGEEQDERAWDIFLNGDKEQRRALQDEIVEKMKSAIHRDKSESEGDTD